MSLGPLKGLQEKQQETQTEKPSPLNITDPPPIAPYLPFSACGNTGSSLQSVTLCLTTNIFFSSPHLYFLPCPGSINEKIMEKILRIEHSTFLSPLNTAIFSADIVFPLPSGLILHHLSRKPAVFLNSQFPSFRRLHLKNFLATILICRCLM